MTQESAPPPPPQSPVPPAPGSPVPPPVDADKDARTMAMLAHLLAIPLGWLGPLIIWLMKKDSSPFVNDQGKEALNFQITVFIAVMAAAMSMFICIGFVLLPAVCIVNLIFCIIGGMKANQGIAYRYPFAIRLIK
ncbi:MAG: DUF4870 domain-containing protein [Planctomycetota bacterium]|nr:DUF4870 domain-containing protein [Planctomycetota bacterium]